MANSHNENDLEQLLDKSGKPYLALSKLGGQHIHIRFTGKFMNIPVIWNARIHTLVYHAQQLQQEPLPSADKPRTIRQFIMVGEEQGNFRELTVGLAVNRIDEPTILKTIIMIRNYKRLRFGLHEFGLHHKLDTSTIL